MTLTDRQRKRVQIREVIADEGHDPDKYEIIWTGDGADDYTLRQLDEGEVALRRREALAEAEEYFSKALRRTFGYSVGDVQYMDVVELAETFAEEVEDADQGDPR